MLCNVLSVCHCVLSPKHFVIFSCENCYINYIYSSNTNIMCVPSCLISSAHIKRLHLNISHKIAYHFIYLLQQSDGLENCLCWPRAQLYCCPTNHPSSGLGHPHVSYNNFKAWVVYFHSACRKVVKKCATGWLLWKYCLLQCHRIWQEKNRQFCIEEITK